MQLLLVRNSSSYSFLHDFQVKSGLYQRPEGLCYNFLKGNAKPCTFHEDCDIWQMCVEQYQRADEYHVNWETKDAFCVSVSPEVTAGGSSSLSALGDLNRTLHFHTELWPQNLYKKSSILLLLISHSLVFSYWKAQPREKKSRKQRSRQPVGNIVPNWMPLMKTWKVNIQRTTSPRNTKSICALMTAAISSVVSSEVSKTYQKCRILYKLPQHLCSLDYLCNPNNRI